MTTVDQQLSEWMKKAFLAAFPDLDLDHAPLAVVPTVDEQHGDYQCNAAMFLAKELGRSPRDIASAAVASVELSPCLKKPPEIAGPGFINLTVDESWLAEFCAAVGIERAPRGTCCW